MVWESDYQRAKFRVIYAKKSMDDAQAALDKAEDEYHQACLALDALEDQPFLCGEITRELCEGL